MCCEIMSCSDSSGGVTCDVSLEEPSPSANAGLGVVRGEELGHRPGGGACVGGPGVAAARNIEGPLGYALPSSTLTAWGLMAPVRAGLAWPAEGRGSGSLLVMAPGGVLPSTTALRTSRMLFAYIYRGWLTFMPSSGPLTWGSGAEGGLGWEGSRPGLG